MGAPSQCFVFLFVLIFCLGFVVLFNGSTLSSNGQRNTGRGWCFSHSDRHALKAPFILRFSEASPCPGSTGPRWLPSSRAPASPAAAFHFHLCLENKKKVPLKTIRMNASQCGRLGGRAGTRVGGCCRSCCSQRAGPWGQGSPPSLSLRFVGGKWAGGPAGGKISLRVRGAGGNPHHHEAWQGTPGWGSFPLCPPAPTLATCRGRCPPGESGFG